MGSKVYEELHTQRIAALHPAAVHHATSIAGCIPSANIFVLLLGVHGEHWHDQKDRRVGDLAIPVFERTQHLRLRGARRVRRRRSGSWARPSDHQGGGHRQRLPLRQAEGDGKVGVKNGKYGPMGEDLFAQACLDKVGVRRIEAFDITTDGACPADRPVDQQKNKKWKPTCAWTATPAMHPFKKVADWIKCHDETTGAFGS